MGKIDTASIIQEIFNNEVVKSLLTEKELEKVKDKIPDDIYERMLKVTKISRDFEHGGNFDCLKSVGYVMQWLEDYFETIDIERQKSVFDFIRSRCGVRQTPNILDIAISGQDDHIGIVTGIDRGHTKIWNKQGSNPIVISEENSFLGHRSGKITYYQPPNKEELKSFLEQT